MSESDTRQQDGRQDHPVWLFRSWLAEAREAETGDPTAMTLATVNEAGRPSARVVLLKEADERGFVFYTNVESRKGNDMAVNPWAALVFHWQTLRRQVRIEGTVEMVSETGATRLRPPGEDMDWNDILRQATCPSGKQDTADSTSRKRKPWPQAVHR